MRQYYLFDSINFIIVYDAELDQIPWSHDKCEKYIYYKWYLKAYTHIPLENWQAIEHKTEAWILTYNFPLP